MEMSESLFLADALDCGQSFIRAVAPSRRRDIRNNAWSEFCQTLLSPAEIAAPALKSYSERLSAIERIYSASLVYAMAQTTTRRKSLAMYFTPPPLSEYVLDRVESLGANFETGNFLDPAAGGASFIGPIANRMRARGATPEHILKALLGIEIDPALANFARAAACSVIEKAADRVVVCGDGLSLGELEGYDTVIGNPPYRVLSPAQRKRMPAWAIPTLGRYANLYSLFILRGLQLLKKDGILAFLVPTSFITGNYFRPLREYLTTHSTILAIDMIEQRKEFFRDVSQDICLFICKNSQAKNDEYFVQSRSVDRNIQWRRDTGYRIENSSDAPWLKSVKQSREVKNETLNSLGYEVRCGPIVHNRDKGLSEGTRRWRRDAVPLVWGHVIKPGKPVEPASRHRQPGDGPITFVSTERTTPPIKSPSIVLQRTNSGDQAQRIRAGFVDQAWINKFGGFYGENHVVVIYPDPEKVQRISMKLLLRLISSKAVDKRLRHMLSSNSVNVTALRELPLPFFTTREFKAIASLNGANFEAAIQKAYR